MSKICMQCGTQLDDNTLFCDNCGAQQPSVNPIGMNMGNMAPVGMPAPSKSKSKLLIIIIAAVATGVIALVLVYFFFIRSTYADPIDKYFEAINDNDPKLMLECYHEDFLEAKYYTYDYEYEYDGDDWKDYGKDDWENYYLNQYKYQIDENIENYEDKLGDDVEFSYDILDKTALDDDKIEEIIESNKEDLDIELDIEEAYKVCYRIDIEGDDDEYSTFSFNYVFKIDGEWYMLSEYLA